jgi:hypothetical protein
MAVDLGTAYVTRSNLAKATDAAALAGARYASRGDVELKEIAMRVAQANFGIGTNRSLAANYDINVIHPAADTIQVNVQSQTQSPTFFTKLIGREDIGVVAAAQATRFPLDLSLVLDVSYSLEMAGAFDDLQESSKNFLENFDDNLDQFGLVTYSIAAEEKMSVRKSFKTQASQIITGLKPIMYTNIEEGLRISKRQLDNAPKRATALKVVVLFTDGRPTAFADNTWLDGTTDSCSAATCADDISGPGACWTNTCTTTSGTGSCSVSAGSGVGKVDTDRDAIPDCYGSVVACDGTGSAYRGLYTLDTGQKIIGFNSDLTPKLTTYSSSTSSPTPRKLPDGSTVNGDNIRRLGMEQAEEWASRIRQAGYTIYAVALGNPDARNELEAPDLDFMRRLANQRGMVSITEPQGEMWFAPTAAELNSTFAKLADRILTRLTQ